MNFFRKAATRPPDGGGDYVNVASEPVVQEAPGQLPSTRKRKSLIRFGGSRARREEQMAALQSGYQDLVGLIGSIQDHLEQGTKTQKKLLTYMEDLPEAVQSLRHVGKASEQQTEMLGLLKDQLKSNVAHDEQMVSSMNRFNETLTVMDKTNRSASETISGLVDRTRESEDMFRVMLERSEKRLMALIAAMIVVILAVAGSAVYVTMSGRSAGDEASSSPVPSVAEELVIREEISSLEPVAAAEEKPRRGFLGLFKGRGDTTN